MGHGEEDSQRDLNDGKSEGDAPQVLVQHLPDETPDALHFAQVRLVRSSEVMTRILIATFLTRNIETRTSFDEVGNLLQERFRLESSANGRRVIVVSESSNVIAQQQIGTGNAQQQTEAEMEISSVGGLCLAIPAFCSPQFVPGRVGQCRFLAQTLCMKSVH